MYKFLLHLDTAEICMQNFLEKFGNLRHLEFFSYGKSILLSLYSKFLRIFFCLQPMRNFLPICYNDHVITAIVFAFNSHKYIA